MCFVWIWEQTAIISLYNINWLLFITEECLLRGTDWVFIYNAVYLDFLPVIHRAKLPHPALFEWAARIFHLADYVDVPSVSIPTPRAAVAPTKSHHLRHLVTSSFRRGVNNEIFLLLGCYTA
jgi:hypothetical protein